MHNDQIAYRFESIGIPTPEMRETVNTELRSFNHAANPRFYVAIERPENEAKPLNLFAFDRDGLVCGGLFAETQFLWLKVSIMAVRSELRRQGVGAKLMALAEAEAVQRGCKHAFVDTMEYQAPNFYLRLGYKVVGQLENWDSHGHTKFYLTKDLP